MRKLKTRHLSIEGGREEDGVGLGSTTTTTTTTKYY